MATVDDDRDEAYHSGLYSLQNEADSTELMKAKSAVRRSVSPGVTADAVKQAHGKRSPRSKQDPTFRSLKILSESPGNMKQQRNLETPMTQLAGRLTGVDLKQTMDSPTSEYDSGVFPSLPESAYGSMQPKSLTNNQLAENSVQSPKDAEKMEVEYSGVNSMSESSKSVDNKMTTALSEQSIIPVGISNRPRSVSPIVPPVGESVEVVTDIPSLSLGSGGVKRAFVSEEGERWRKTPRLSSDMDDGMSQKPAIRVKTIVSPVGSPRPKKGGVSPYRSPRDSHSPVSISITDETNMDTASVRPISPGSVSPSSTQAPVVNFRDIGDLAKSANRDQTGMVYITVNQHSLTPGTQAPILIGVSDLARRGPAVSTDSPMKKIVSKGAMFRESPKKGGSPVPPTTTPAIFQLLPTMASIPRASSPGRVSPAPSPRSPAALSSEDKKEAKTTEKKDGEKEAKPGNALLQVTEAHLATLSDEDGDTPLHLAIIHENFGLTQYLVKLIVGVYMNLDIANNMRQTPLHLAVITRQPQMVQLLVGAGASVNFPDRKGNTALHLAAARKDVRILQLLAQATNPLPDYNAKNFSGLTSIHVATKESTIDVLKFFFQMGANKNAPDACSGRTALHYAVESENFTLVNFLLENNVNVNAATFSGNTPLHVAAGRRLKEIVALLMAYGANPAIANGEGDFPSDLPASLLMQRAKMHNAH